MAMYAYDLRYLGDIGRRISIMYVYVHIFYM
jgi:hypothetical protein